MEEGCEVDNVADDETEPQPSDGGVDVAVPVAGRVGPQMPGAAIGAQPAKRQLREYDSHLKNYIVLFKNFVASYKTISGKWLYVICVILFNYRKRYLSYMW